MHGLANLFGRSALVVKQVSIDESAEMQVEIVARKAGLVSWVLSLLGIDSTFTLRVYADRLESTEGSLSGRIKTVIPMTAIDTYTCGFTKPIQLFVTAAIFVVLSLWLGINGAPGMVVFFLLMFAIACFVAYFLRKCLILSFTTNGANGIFFLFKRSVIEGVNVDETLAENVAEIVKRDYIAQTGK